MSTPFVVAVVESRLPLGGASGEVCEMVAVSLATSRSSCCEAGGTDGCGGEGWFSTVFTPHHSKDSASKV